MWPVYLDGASGGGCVQANWRLGRSGGLVARDAMVESSTGVIGAPGGQSGAAASA